MTIAARYRDGIGQLMRAHLDAPDALALSGLSGFEGLHNPASTH